MGNIKVKKALQIIRKLKKAYPYSKASSAHKTPFQLLITTILSAQCTDVVSDKTASKLFSKYKDALGFAAANQKTLEKEVRPTGLYRAKARNIIAASKKIVTRFNNKVPGSMQGLIQLDGVGRKTANIVLSSGFKKSEGIAVDTHVKRVSLRLGLTSNTNPDKIEKDLLSIIPFRYWLDLNYILVAHGRRVCRARNPLCGECLLINFCDFARSRR